MHSENPLGKSSAYPTHYDASLLYAIPRQNKRHELGIQGTPIFTGADFWTGYELSWLNTRGKPQVGILQLRIPCESTHIVESKSLKLYLNSLNNTVFENTDAIRACIFHDINQLIWQGIERIPSSASVEILLPEQFQTQKMAELDGLSLDRLDCDCTHYLPAPELLRIVPEAGNTTEILCSQLLKSNCLVTGQPDWASVQINYSGVQIDHEGLLRYIVSFRNHNEFHEQCVERIFMDIWQRCAPVKLSVYARYTRRGGLDINPFRTSHPQHMPVLWRTARQ